MKLLQLGGTLSLHYVIWPNMVNNLLPSHPQGLVLTCIILYLYSLNYSLLQK
jgi:hypothetical protein